MNPNPRSTSCLVYFLIVSSLPPPANHALAHGGIATCYLQPANSQVLTGAPFVKAVITGNAKVEVVAEILIPVAEWLGLDPTTEQPSGSLMYDWEKLHNSIEHWDGAHCALGTFGSISSKPLDLRGKWKGVPILHLIYVKLAIIINPDRISQHMRLTKQSGRLVGK